MLIINVGPNAVTNGYNLAGLNWFREQFVEDLEILVFPSMEFDQSNDNYHD
eukprot:CAMPEP_0116964530 /NCGR_PEP_ID=MMETSP0467-20121206/48627_1 /TAXON_ID=283647 /ORGANISM="Mesodinium pulex, Strain SPMC105" /LENGTH=50 /DNA_ID=CAMNT_0004653499 /DNA_START=87 /DNA_END=239 /DNA_ORIENTATION=-